MARDDQKLAEFLEQATVSDTSPLESWRDVQRVRPGSRDHIALKIPGALDEYTDTTLTSLEDAIVSNIPELRKHDSGWTVVEE